MKLTRRIVQKRNIILFLLFSLIPECLCVRWPKFLLIWRHAHPFADSGSTGKADIPRRAGPGR
ncbi:MAG: hypothetical protein AMJ56_17845 [Anaerolineae bacterium SG8_19]|nr:MAG: hypothetical protein AMJ56_17845 [Anaerolineae bacterium SG8_19]